MRRWLLHGLLLGAWTFYPGLAPGQEGSGPAEGPVPEVLPPPLPPLPPLPLQPGCAADHGRRVSVPRGYLIEEQCATTLPRLKLREEVVGHGQGLDVKYIEKRECITELEVKPRQVEQQVVCTEVVPETVTDPCTGHCTTVYKSVPVVRTVPVTVYDTIPVTREVVVKVPCVVPGQPLVVKRLVADAVTVPAVQTRLRAVIVPNEVSVPECPPLPCPHPHH